MELTEVLMAYIGCFYAFMAKSTLVFMVWIALMGWLIKFKRSAAPGFLKHSLYVGALLEFDNYPSYQQQMFIE